MTQKSDNQSISTITLRRTVGILGIALPFVLISGAYFFKSCHIQNSISLYYHTIMRNFLEGVLIVLAVIMFAYKGYDIKDRIAGKLVFVFALGIAFFPTVTLGKGLTQPCNIIPKQEFMWVEYVHLSSAVLFFLTLSYISTFLFTLTIKNNQENHTNEKKIRNKIYLTSGITIFISLVVLILWFTFFKKIFPSFEKLHPAFWLETIALIAFGISWLIKGEAAFKDK